MPQERYILNDLARSELDALRSSGVNPTDDDIVLINALAADVLAPDTRQALARGRPIECGGVWLWPLTIAASDWFNEVGCNLSNARAALAYAMAHGEDPELCKARQLTVWSWYIRIHARVEQLNLAIDYCLAQESETEIPHRPSEEHGMTAGELSAAMIATVGGDPAMWEHQMSVGFVRAILSTTAAQAKASGVAPSVARATMALGMACEKIKQRQAANG